MIHQFTRIFYTTGEFIIMAMPAMAAGLLTSEAHTLKISLHNKLLEERDDERGTEIDKFIDYINGRPFRLSLFDMLPLNYQLPLILLNICITYQIYIVQFTKLY
ncbi:hypothetical protein ACJJTC_016999 [Scirpophaga incertulas]